MGGFHGRKFRDPIGSSDAHIIGPEFSRIANKAFADDSIVIGYVSPVDRPANVLEKEHPGAFDVVDDDDVVHFHVRRSAALKNFLCVGEGYSVDFDVGGFPYGIDQ